MIFDLRRQCRGRLKEHNAVADGICAVVVETLIKPVSNKPGEISGLTHPYREIVILCCSKIVNIDIIYNYNNINIK